jgi:hypothetical protein
MLNTKLLSCIQAGTPQGDGPAEAIDLDGTNDYFSRASDFTGNADGKTFTFSAWVWNTSSASGDFYKSSSRFRIDIAVSNLRITGQDASGNPILVYTNTNFKSQVEIGTFYHILISIDLTNASNRHVYINDVAISGGSFGTYANANIDFTNTTHGIGENFKGRLSHVFLDYQYRNLSIEANRRLFITADRKPTPKATLQALNPILFMPMDDPTTSHINLGTGGNMTLNGVIARSGRGPNQFNAPYSDLDGAADYLSRTSITGIADGDKFTFFCVFQPDQVASTKTLMVFSSATDTRLRISTPSNASIQVTAFDSSGTTLLTAFSAANTLVIGRTYILSMSVDLSNSSNRHAYLNGAALSMTWSTYVSGNIDLAITTSPRYYVAASENLGTYYDGRLGNVFFHTSYIDLSVPANLAKFVTGTGIDAKPVDLGANGELPFGTAPLIYLPMYGNNAGKNYGTGGDFTVNSGPYPGARGPNEFFGNRADYNGSTGYLEKTTALTGVSDGKTFSIAFWLNKDSNVDSTIITAGTGAAFRFDLTHNNSNPATMRCVARDTAANNVLSFTTNNGIITSGTTAHVLLAIDLTDTGKRKLYVNGTAIADGDITWTTYSNTAIDWATNTTKVVMGRALNSSGNWLDGKLSEFYFTTSYIDFSQEANRLKFRDCYGSPVALLPQIEAGTIPNPAIYMRFDPANQGKNYGTGGDFTKSGTINDGGQL